MNYLLDANTFIEAKNRYYSMLVCPGYWEWMLKNNVAGQVASIDMVKQELERGNDELKEWSKKNSQMFIGVSDEKTQDTFSEIATYAASLDMKPGALDEFLGCADPWLVAKARATGAVVVTHESYIPGIKKKILIPNVCRYFGVSYMNTFELLHKLEAEFVLGAA
ncbi:DUF4411 family protein [Halomonas alkalisoli]|uniref:DUF4411 family protein n=1 Tax=Halomonas alkalisoli TaxID=2907158 RepID=UPI001F2DA47D|nr:DUF4411 family protein [Halomonas alkalisoli]MCE9684468.1 DUF4411 family protein [Halomonas alkalisoli]